MKILGINASPRIGGNSDLLLDKALEGAKSASGIVEKIVLSELKFSPCQECEKISHDGLCLVQDEFQIIFDKIKQADALILVSPIFFGSVSAQAKMMIDRFQCAWVGKNIFKKEVFPKKGIGTFICVQASDRMDFIDNAKAIVKNLFAVINFEYKKELFVVRVSKKAQIKDFPDILVKAFDLGKSIAGNKDN
jgi:multimeric flavodoxin WrbA